MELRLSSPFKTPEFNVLFQEWNRKLEESGLKEIENFELPDPSLKAWHHLKWKNRATFSYEETEAYYEMAGSLLDTFEFKSELQKKIWELHYSGLSVRKISDYLRREWFWTTWFQTRGFSKTRIQIIIFNIERKSGLKNG